MPLAIHQPPKQLFLIKNYLKNLIQPNPLMLILLFIFLAISFIGDFYKFIFVLYFIVWLMEKWHLIDLIKKHYERK